MWQQSGRAPAVCRTSYGETTDVHGSWETLNKQNEKTLGRKKEHPQLCV